MTTAQPFSIELAINLELFIRVLGTQYVTHRDPSGAGTRMNDRSNDRVPSEGAASKGQHQEATTSPRVDIPSKNSPCTVMNKLVPPSVVTGQASRQNLSP